MNRTTGKSPTKDRDEDYLALVRRFPLRPIRSEAEYEGAARLLDSLVLRGLSPGESDYLDVLTLLVQAYDDEQDPAGHAESSPAELLRALVEHRGITTTALGRVIGSKGVASELLNGKREPSKAQIRKLAEFFRVEPGAFFGRSPHRPQARRPTPAGKTAAGGRRVTAAR
jgi:HTH-type transcriptional regulator / antitoxin HigA